MPIYWLYALLFADSGLDVVQISALFAIWSAVGLVTEVPAGALADRFSRRGALVTAGSLQALGFAAWTVEPDFAGFAVGFVLWGLGGSLASGSFEALVYDGLAASGDEDAFAGLLGRCRAAALLAQLPAGLAATVLFAAGGFELVGWVSVATCLTTALLATALPEPPHSGAAPDDETDLGYLATLRSGVVEALTRPALLALVVTVALLGGFDAVEEYFPLLAADLGVATGSVPLAIMAIPLAGAAGAALGSVGARLPGAGLAALLGVAAAALVVPAVVRHPAALAGVVAFYGLYRLVLVVAEVRLQHAITGPARATVASVASLGTEVVGFAVYGVWVLGEVALFAAVVAVVGAGLAPAVRGAVR